MKKAILLPDRCDHSPLCPAKRVCPTNAISQKKKFFFIAEVPVIDQEKCVGCGKCLSFCPHKAIVLKNSEKKKKGRK